MIHKYKIAFWNILCVATIGTGFVLIFPYISLQPSLDVEEKILDGPPIIEINSHRKVWKRGKHNSSTVIKESSSSSNISGKKSHSCDGWISILWRKEDDS